MSYVNDNVEAIEKGVLLEALRAYENRAEAIFRRLVRENDAVERLYLTKRFQSMLDFVLLLEQKIAATSSSIWIDEIAVLNNPGRRTHAGIQTAQRRSRAPRLRVVETYVEAP